MFCEGIRSERELMRIVSDRLSLRWYVGYDLFEALPHHSSLTRIRDRFGLSVFREFFERIVELCRGGAGLGRRVVFRCHQGGRQRLGRDSIEPRFFVEEHLEGLFTEEDPLGSRHEESVSVADGRGESLVAEFYESPSANDEALIERDASKDDWISRNGHQRREVKGVWYKRKADFLASKTDPDSSPMKRRESKGSHLGYYTRKVPAPPSNPTRPVSQAPP
jgi:Transposase domain (DUF772)